MKNLVTVSPKYQIVIPQAVREALGVKPGQKMRVLAYNQRIVLIPDRPIEEALGSLKDLNTDVQREEEDEER
jgi:AbrB family looped-hinge helix DNA binding protein